MSSGLPEEYTNTVADGGNPALEDLNRFYSVRHTHPSSPIFRSGPPDPKLTCTPRAQNGDFSWVMTCSALVLLMIPGVGFFYSGLARRKSALALILLSLLSIAVVGFQWFFWGYSLAFSHTATSPFIGDLSNFGLKDVLGAPSVGSAALPDLLFCLYQGMFAAITYAARCVSPQLTRS